MLRQLNARDSGRYVLLRAATFDVLVLGTVTEGPGLNNATGNAETDIAAALTFSAKFRKQQTFRVSSAPWCGIGSGGGPMPNATHHVWHQ